MWCRAARSVTCSDFTKFACIHFVPFVYSFVFLSFFLINLCWWWLLILFHFILFLYLNRKIFWIFVWFSLESIAEISTLFLVCVEITVVFSLWFMARLAKSNATCWSEFRSNKAPTVSALSHQLTMENIRRPKKIHMNACERVGQSSILAAIFGFVAASWKWTESFRVKSSVQCADEASYYLLSFCLNVDKRNHRILPIAAVRPFFCIADDGFSLELIFSTSLCQILFYFDIPYHFVWLIQSQTHFHLCFIEYIQPKLDCFGMYGEFYLIYRYTLWVLVMSHDAYHHRNALCTLVRLNVMTR